MVAPLALALAPEPTSKWYGPVAASFTVSFEGNPFDPDQNDVHVRFSPVQGRSLDRIAYFDGEKWSAVLLAPKPGPYRATLLRNGKAVSGPVLVQIKPSQRLKDGFVRRDPMAVNRFRLDNGRPFFPIGHNLAWPGPGASFADLVPQMKAAGLNWTRIWACSWSDMNPWWPNDGSSKDVLWKKALDYWQNTINLCERNGIRFQFVLFHHGLFSSTVNANWPDHPWNAKNGGFLKKPDDFFTDPQAIKRAKMWSRYAVARWGHSPSIMAWELFNEVEWCDGYRNNPQSVAKWHALIAEYLRSIDPYKHLVTSSSSMEHPEIYARLDYYQPHTYPPDIVGAVTQQTQPGDKPLFFGEFGAMELAEKEEWKTIRDGLYAAMLANHAGTAMYWWWDRVAKLGLYRELKTASEIVQASGLADRPKAKMLAPSVSTAGHGTVSFVPGRGWAPTEKFVFNLPEDADPSNTGLVAGYLQSQNGSHKEMGPHPLTFRFDAPSDGEFRVRVASVAKSGAHLRLWLDGELADEMRAEPSERERPVDTQLKAAYKKGFRTVKLENIGEDWAVVAGIEVSPLGPQASALALGESDWLLMRLVADAGAPMPVKAKIGKLPLKDGKYSAMVWRLNSGIRSSMAATVKGGRLVRAIAIDDEDVVVCLHRKSSPIFQRKTP